MTSLVELFSDVDDFCPGFYSQWEHQQLGTGAKKRIRAGQLTLSEMMTIMIHFHQAQYRHFKAYYEEYVQVRLSGEFPKLVSQGRFVQLMPTLAVPLYAYLQQRCVPTRGVTFVDSTALRVWDNPHIERHRVFKGGAGRGKTSMGWFYGPLAHLMVNIKANSWLSISRPVMSMIVSPANRWHDGCRVNSLAIRAIFLLS